MAASYLAACIYNQITEELEKKKAKSTSSGEKKKGEEAKEDNEERKVKRVVEL